MSPRGTSNGNEAGSSYDRRARKVWLVETYRADVTLYKREGVLVDFYALVDGDLVEPVPVCRCYRCGDLLTVETVTADRIIPGCQGGTYRRENIRPACGPCNSKTGGATRRKKK